MKVTQAITVAAGLLATLCSRADALSEACQARKEEYQSCFDGCNENSGYQPGGGGGSLPTTTTSTQRPTTTTTTTRPVATTTTTTRPLATTTAATKPPSSGGCDGCLLSDLVDKAPYTCNKTGVAGFCASPWDSDNDDTCCSSATFDSFAANMGCMCKKGSGGSAPTTTTTTTRPGTTTTTTTRPGTTTTTTRPPVNTTSPSAGGGGSCSGCLLSQLVDNAPWTCNHTDVKQFCTAPWDTDADDSCCSSAQFPAFAANMGCKCNK